MEAFQFQRTKKKQANEDNAVEQKIYCLVLNSNDRVAGTTHNQAEFNIPFEFLPHNYEYYSCQYSIEISPGVYRDAYGEWGGISSTSNVIAAQIFDPILPVNNLTVPGSRVYTNDTGITLPSDLKVKAFRTAAGTGGQYQLNKDFPNITTTSFTGAMANGAITITGVVGTPVIGRYVQVGTSLTAARVMAQDETTPTTWYVSRVSTAAITAGTTFTQSLPFYTKLNNSLAYVSLDFGCSKLLYDTSSKGPSSIMGAAQRYTGSSASGAAQYYRAWFNENPSQIINMNNFSGTIRARITNADNFLLEDLTGTNLNLGDMTSWRMMISFTPIPSSAIETQCY